MATISAEGGRGNHTFSLTVTETATSNTANTSTLSYALKITPAHSSYQWNGEGTNVSYTVTINGSVVASGYIPDYDGATKNIASGTTTVTHNVGGAKSISYSFSVADRDEESYTCGDASASGTMALTTISIASYTLSISAGKGSTITVNRTSSPKQGAATGNLSNGAKVYYSDVLKITYGASTGYNLGTHTVNGASFTSGSSHTVTGAVSVVSTATAKTFTLSISAGTGSTITVKKGNTALSNGATISYGDSLTIAFGAESGYEIVTHTVNGSTFTSGSSHTVTGAVAVVATAKQLGLVYIHNGTEYVRYQAYIDDGAKWKLHIPYIDNGNGWDLCS